MEAGAPRRDLTPALIGLVGVLIGALTTGGIAYLGARNARLTGERAATRLVVVEIEHDQVALRNAYAFGDPNEPLATGAWREQQSELARTLDGREWAAVSSFYADLALDAHYINGGRCNTRQGELALQLLGEGNHAIDLFGQRYLTVRRIVGPAHGRACTG